MTFFLILFNLDGNFQLKNGANIIRILLEVSLGGTYEIGVEQKFH